MIWWFICMTMGPISEINPTLLTYLKSCAALKKWTKSRENEVSRK